MKQLRNKVEASANFRYRAFLVSILIPVSGLCQAQNSQLQTIAIASQNTKWLYEKSIGVQSGLVNGGDYKGYESRAGEHPYFLKEDWATGSIFYDGSLFEDVALLYDLEKDKVIFEHPLYDVKIDLIGEKVKYFSLHDHMFVHLETSSQDIKFTGYYDRLYDGPTKAYVKRSKNFQQPIHSGVMINVFEEKNSYYVVTQGIAHRVKSMHDLLASFGASEKEVKQFAKKNKLRFKSDPDNTIVKLSTYFDSLTR